MNRLNITNPNLLYTKKEFLLLERLQTANTDEMLSWKLPNMIYPIGAIIISLVCFLLFKNSEQITFLSFINLLLNGSIPMMALNRLSSLGVHIVKFNKGKEKQKSNTNTYNLRVKILYYSQGLIILISLFYAFQVIHTPFPLSYWVILQLLISGLCVHQSLKISKYSFLLQERLVDITFEQEIRDEIKKNGHGKNWTKE